MAKSVRAGHNALAIPVLTYGSETWALRKKDEQRISAAEMRFLRKTAGYTLMDRKRNENILKRSESNAGCKKS